MFSDGWESILRKIPVSELRDRQPCNSLRQRQLELIAAGVKRHTKERETEEMFPCVASWLFHNC